MKPCFNGCDLECFEDTSRRNFHGEHDKIGLKSSLSSVFLVFQCQNRYFMPIFNDFEPGERIFLLRVGLRDKLFYMVISNFCTYITMEVDEVWHPESLKNDKRVEKNELAGLLSMLKI